MPHKIHYHKGYGWVYHRKDGAIVIHGRRHSKRDLKKDRQRMAKSHLKKKQRQGYGHTGDYYGQRKPRKGTRAKDFLDGFI
ncbi:hypothetical protein K9M74_02680 [Candidatus Woesearchaeota archaeon]|nr:hypothetical protein [Candidatus Woesearchaeota archaeon]